MPWSRKRENVKYNAAGTSFALAQRGEYFRRMLGRARHPPPSAAYPAVGADPDGRADDARHLLAVHGLLAPGAVGAHDAAVRIREQGEGQAVLLSEAPMACGIVGRDAEDDGAELAQLIPRVAKAAGFLGAARRIVLRV